MLLIMPRIRNKPLSFSTTMRNPERIASFLNCILPFENQILTNDIILKILKNIIGKKLYKTNYELRRYRDKYLDEEYNFTDSELNDIISNSPQDHKEAGFDKGWPSRFDTFYKLSKEFGFMYYEIGKPIIITSAGHMLIDAFNEIPCNDKKIRNIFLNSMMKYQINNPYRRNANYNIPLVLLLQVIKLLKDDPEENDAGVFKKELSLFICWKDNNAESLYRKIKEIREKHGYNYSDEYMYDICLEILDTDQRNYIKMEKVCGETIDEYIRKMRITGVISLRGNGRFLDFNTLEMNKIDYILKTYTEIKMFDSLDDYTMYMGTVDTKILSYEEIELSKLDKIKMDALYKFSELYTKEQIFNELKVVSKTKESRDPILRFINAPTRLEFLLSISLVQNFKELKVFPNYPVDDEGLPTFTAGGDMADILCKDEKYDSTVEVTLACGRSVQVNNEIIPIRRHLLKLKETNDNVFSVFIAPKIHEDVYQVSLIYKLRENIDILAFDVEDIIEKFKSISEFNDLLRYKVVE